jgi:DNA polymerase
MPGSYRSLAAVRTAAKRCKACPLWKLGTQTVFGEGPGHAQLMCVGEQPGDKEDLEGRPFVGPAGQMLRKAMAEAGIAPDTAYITNAVKHFKFVQRGKRRMHQKPAAPEVAACNAWLQQEITFVAPQLIVLLGTTAVSAVLGKAGTITSLRGKVIDRAPLPAVLVTVHPSFLLRLPDEAARRREYKAFVKDLTVAVRSIS